MNGPVAGNTTLIDPAAVVAPTVPPPGSVNWDSLGEQFDLGSPSTNFSGFFLALVPRAVRDAVARHRTNLDTDVLAYVDTMGYTEHGHHKLEDEVRQAAGVYLSVNGLNEIALTDSTTMGLGLLYSGIKIGPDQHVLTTDHEHPATREALRMRSARSGTRVNTIALYEEPAAASADEMVARIRAAITPETRVLALTWVHSVSGVKLPAAHVAEVVTAANAGRSWDRRLMFCLDGVHGLGIEDASLPDLGCDFFAAGTHKWMLGPRGTGILWGREEAWDQVFQSMLSFSGDGTPAQRFTLGGLHSFENRWAAADAFKFHLALGRARVARRLAELNQSVRDEFARIPSVVVHTPRNRDLSAGITCFSVAGLTHAQVVQKLAERGLHASLSPHVPETARVSVSLWHTEKDVAVLVAALQDVCAAKQR